MTVRNKTLLCDARGKAEFDIKICEITSLCTRNEIFSIKKLIG